MKFLLILASSLALAAFGGPCDILDAAGTPCVAAFSLVRSLYRNYSGPLYQVRRRSDNATSDVRPLTPGGFANASAQDSFCGSADAPVPPMGSIVNLVPVGLPAYSFRHCQAQGFVTPTDGDLDHFFKLLPALNGAQGALSFQSVNFPTYYIAPVAGAEPGRLGVVEAPPAADASWSVAPVAGGGVSLKSLGRGGGLAMTVGSNLTGGCEGNYAPPSASVYLLAGGAAPAAYSAWTLEASACDIWRLYDQSPQGNHLDTAPGGGAAPQPDRPVAAASLPVTASGHRVYGAFFSGAMGYRRDNTTGVAVGNEEETIYMVTSGTHFNDGCCFDFGNAEANNHDDGPGTMEAVYFGTWNATRDGWCGGAGSGPWVMSDLEDGLWACNASSAINAADVSQTANFVTAMVKGGSNGFGLKGGDATKAGGLAKIYEGPRPKGYQPMRKQGSIILGIGGDNSDSAIGSFFEGVMTSGYTTDATDAAVQADIAAARYGL